MEPFLASPVTTAYPTTYGCGGYQELTSSATAPGYLNFRYSLAPRQEKFAAGAKEQMQQFPTRLRWRHIRTKICHPITQQIAKEGW